MIRTILAKNKVARSNMKRKAAAKAGQQKRQKIHDKWVARHPDRARAERAIRKRNERDARQFGHKVHGTAQTHARAARQRQGALARLYEAGDLSIEQLAASQEIMAAHQRIITDVQIGSVSLEARVDNGRRHEAVFYEKLGAVRRDVAYSRWRAKVAMPGLALAMIVEDAGVSVAARRFGMRNTRAKKALCEALDLWRDLVGDACREIDDATLLAAQAGIL